MDVLYRTEVTPDQIDHLGHLNVRFYGMHARTAALDYLTARGTEPESLIQRDTYTRHHHEQFEGAPLEVRGGVLDARSDRIRLYEELVNPDTGDLAASFVLTFEPNDPAAAPALDAAEDGGPAGWVEVPEHGRARSIRLDEDVLGGWPTLDIVRERDLAHRLERTIGVDECDASGFVPSSAMPDLVWGGEPVRGREFQMFYELPGGGQMGMATMETRATWSRLARAGDRVQSFAGGLAVGEKTLLTRCWLFDVERGDLLGVFTVLNLAFDTTARRSAVIPEEARARFRARLQPDLAVPAG
jgi:acyl-CoA thioesterase FadM